MSSRSGNPDGSPGEGRESAPGDGLAKYRILSALGRGGMGEVLLAALEGPAGFSKLVVIKKMRDHVAGDGRFRTMLLDEARLAARLRHPNVVQTIEVAVDEGQPHIVMEYLEGQPLNAILAECRRNDEHLEAALAARIVCDALAGLHYAHELDDFDGKPLGVVHRDVSPHNIFVTYDGEVKLLDFGVAKSTTNVEETELGTVKGKIAYMAPEQARDELLDRRVDLFAMGLVLFELVTSRRLLEGESQAAILDALLHKPFDRANEVRPDLDPAMAEVIDRATAKRVDDRFQTAHEMRLALLPFARDVERDDVGRLVRGMFARERREIQARVRSRMRPVGVDDGSTRTIQISRAMGESASQAAPATRASTNEATGQTSQRTPPPNVLSQITAPPRGKQRMLAWVAAAACIVIGWSLVGGRTTRSAPASTTPAVPSPSAEEGSPDVLLRLQGSDAVGSELIPATAEAYLLHRGASFVARDVDAVHHRLRLIAKLPGHQTPQAIDIVSGDTSTAFTGLLEGACDIGMAARRPTSAEIDRFASVGRGDPTHATREHVIALDGISIVVPRANQVPSLDQTAVARIFSGDATDWTTLGEANAPSGTLRAYVRDEGSSTTDGLERLLGFQHVGRNAKAFADDGSLIDAVAADPQGIGYARTVRANGRTVPIRTGGAPISPNAFSIATESYPLSRRLYLYTSGRPTNPSSDDFLRFALSADGQKAVRAAGFVDLNVRTESPPACDARCPPRYAALTARARRASLDFRFLADGTELDGRAVRDLDRLVELTTERRGSRVALAGFSDPTGEDRNVTVSDSLALARVVAAALRSRGVEVARVESFGGAMPVYAGTGEIARVRNRRVEVWLEEESTAAKTAGAGAAPAARTTPSLPTEIRTHR